MAYYNPTHEQPQGQYPAPIVYYAAPAIIYQQPAIKLYGPYYKKETSIGLGFIHIVIACISIAAGVVAVVYGAYYGDTIVGIWTGAMVRQINFSTSYNIVISKLLKRHSKARRRTPAYHKFLLSYFYIVLAN